MSTTGSKSDGRGGLLIVAALALVMGLFTGDAIAQTGTLTGTVTDATTGLPIEGALVVARGMGMGGPHHGGEIGRSHHGGGWHGPRHVFTGADGGYVIEELAPGEYWVACGTPGYIVEFATAIIADGGTTVLDFALDPLEFGAVEGTVTDAATGLPIVGARVVLIPSVSGELRTQTGDDAGDGLWLHAVTGDDGRYLMENIPAGEYEAHARSWGYLRPDPVPVTVVADQTVVVDFALEPLTFGSLEGHVTDAATGDPIAGAVVFAFQHLPGSTGPGEGSEAGENGRWNMVRTDPSGFYRFEELAAGTWSVRAFAMGYRIAEGSAEIVPDQTAVLDLVLEAW